MTTRPTAAQNAKEIAYLKQILDKLTKIVVGNGEPGMDEDVREIKRRLGSVESDMKEVKRMLQDAVGYAGVKFDARNHPGRRAEDNGEASENWFVNRVLPGLVQYMLIAIGTTIFVLIVTHIEEITHFGG